MSFAGKVAIVTGSGSPRGIGREITRVLAEKGCSVAVADMNLEGAQANADELKKDFGCDSMAVSVNITDEDSVKAMFDAVFAKYGRIDILCNNAGITQPVTIDEMTKDDFMKIMNVNLVGTFLCSKLVVPYMVKGSYGRIVNTSSVSAKCGGGVYGGAHYCAAKAGIIGFTRAQAMELCKAYKDMITVNAVCPGLIATDIRATLSDEKEKESRAKQAMGRAGTAREVANTIAWLASDEASYVSGEDININGATYFG
ncbi:MAG: SDR family oxidoreductase [Lachnospiraceae bacterium]|nr:SDR family oxidoreductase [Lachnospiraceae bacterium]